MEIQDQILDAWEEEFKPIINNNPDTDSWGGLLFETYDPDLNFVRNCPENHIWTLMDGDEGMWIGSGYHLVNRIGYFITEIPWSKDCEIQVEEN